VKVFVLHENPEWYPPLAAAFDAEGLEHEQWLLGDGSLDLDATPPPGVFWSRMSASSHTRGHGLAKDHTRAVLSWLEAHGRRVVNGRRVLELEMSKVDQLTALRAAGFDVPRTFAVAGAGDLRAAAEKVGSPFIVKPNQGGKGLGVRRYDDVPESLEPSESPDGITLVQEYVAAAAPFITRVEIVGGALVYAIRADTARGGFELCPADACAVDDAPLFALRPDVDQSIVDRYLEFAARQGIEVAGFEFIETADGRLVTYDINTNTNFNPAVEAVAPRSGPRMIARFLRTLLEQ
jgi:glutathione synthase/RimK-type ligase-like ATP-grasp enzyme